MNKQLLFRGLLTIFLLLSIIIFTQAQTASVQKDSAEQKPDTVRVGIYITSVHDIDFKQKEYTVNLWLWLKYKNKDFGFYNNLEIPQAKSVSKSFVTTDTSNRRVYMQMKLQCVMKMELTPVSD